LGPAFDALERRDLGLQPDDHLPQGVILGQQPLGESLQLTARQARKADLLRSRHGGDRSGPGRSGATASAHLGPAFCPSYAALRLGPEIKGLFATARDRPLALREREIGPINSSAGGRAGYRSAPR